jgi:hypothetical protein
MLSQVQKTSIPMQVVDTYVVCLIERLNKTVDSTIYTNSKYMLRASSPSFLVIWNTYTSLNLYPYDTPYMRFPYTVKELLAYLYDKIESN